MVFLTSSFIFHGIFPDLFILSATYFTVQYKDKWHFFSSPQPHEGIRVVAADYDYHLSFSGDWYKEICLHAHGFFYLMLKGNSERVPVICNPCTGQKLTLPKAKAKNNDLRSFFGYDPIEKQLKVLCMTVTSYRGQVNSREHQVLTLGKGAKLSWRKIKCLFQHYPEKESNGVCINGVLYYIAWSWSNDNKTRFVACFDVRSEKFSSIEMTHNFDLAYISGLINFKGNLGVVMYLYGRPYELWVIDDYKKDKLSKRVFPLPKTGNEVVKSIWANDTGEIVLAITRCTHLFFLYYYNMEKKTTRRVQIKGIEEKLCIRGEDRPAAQFTFPNYVENVMFLS